MANQAESVANDLMVGAGVLYFKRSDDPNGFHHLGNAEAFTISNDIEKIEKNSSMNKKRELMASVITSIKPSASITLNEYNPYNLALGLFGTEGMHSQAAVTLTDEVFTVTSVPGIITLKDADGNRYFDVSDVKVKPAASVPTKFKVVSATTDMSIATTTNTDDTLKDTLGGTIELDPAGFAGTKDVRVFITVKTAPTAAGDLNGLVLEVREGLVGSVQTFSCTTPSTLTETYTLTGGAKLKVTVAATKNFTANTNMNEALLSPSVTDFAAGKDFFVDAQMARGGVITIKEGGKIKTGDTIKVSAKIPKGEYPMVAGGNAGDIRGELLFLGDPNVGGNYVVEAWNVKVTPDGDLSGLISDNEFGSFQLKIDFLSDYANHPDAPYYSATMIGRADGKDKVTSGIYDPHY